MTSRPLLSRVADSVYWLSRYIERADNVARVVDVNLQLMLDAPIGTAAQWQPLIDTSGDSNAFATRHGTATRDNVIDFLTLDTRNPNSILSCLRSARENARTVRDTISSEMWEQVNRMYLMLNEEVAAGRAPKSHYDLFYEIRTGCHLFQGITDSTMSHNEAWHFMRLGSKIERADKTTRILDVKYFLLLPAINHVGTSIDDIQWSAVLKSVSAFEMYRKTHGRISPARIAEFLLMDREFPRAVHYCLIDAEDSVHAITGTPVGRFQNAAEQRLGQIRSELDYMHVEEIIAGGLHEYLDSFQTKLNLIDESIFNTFFTLKPVSGGASAS
jgi:uncharacterized alpha-E superfamily protein